MRLAHVVLYGIAAATLSGCGGVDEAPDDTFTVDDVIPAPAGAPPMPDSLTIVDSMSIGDPLQEIAYVSFTVVSAPPEAEVYLVPEIDADRDPTILQNLTPSSPYYRGRTGANGLAAEDTERSYHLIVRHPSGIEDRRRIRLRRDETPTFNVQLR